MKLQGKISNWKDVLEEDRIHVGMMTEALVLSSQMVVESVLLSILKPSTLKPVDPRMVKLLSMK